LHGLLVLALLASATAAAAAPCPRGTLTGEVTFVRDGDTIVVGSMLIRLNALAAPEWDEPGGNAAMDTMLELVAGRTLRCELNGERTHDRCVGVCYLDGVDISAEMVRRGGRSGLPALQRRPVSRDRGGSRSGGATGGRTYPAAGVLSREIGSALRPSTRSAGCGPARTSRRTSWGLPVRERRGDHT
jgi:micrococcal nuclease